MTAHICQYAQRHTYDGGITGTHTVHAIVEVGTVAHGCHHEDGHQHKQYPTGGNLIFATERHHVGIVQVMALVERNGGLK